MEDCRLYVLGDPFPDMDSSYRGIDRDIPLYREDLPEHHPANVLMLQAIAGAEGGSPIASLQLARGLAREFNLLAGRSAFEVVEAGADRRDVRHGRERFGVDLVLNGGAISFLGTALILAPPDYETGRLHSDPGARPSQMDEELWAFRRAAREALNEFRLFETIRDAERVVDQAAVLIERYGPIWEAEDFVWGPLEIWRC